MLLRIWLKQGKEKRLLARIFNILWKARKHLSRQNSTIKVRKCEEKRPEFTKKKHVNVCRDKIRQEKCGNVRKKHLNSTKSTLTPGKCVQIGQIQERGLSEEQYNETRIQIGTHRIQFQYRGEIIGQPRLDRSIQFKMCSQKQKGMKRGPLVELNLARPMRSQDF